MEGVIKKDKQNNYVIVDKDSHSKILGFGCRKNAPSNITHFWEKNLNKRCFFEIKPKNFFVQKKCYTNKRNVVITKIIDEKNDIDSITERLQNLEFSQDLKKFRPDFEEENNFELKTQIALLDNNIKKINNFLAKI